MGTRWTAAQTRQVGVGARVAIGFVLVLVLMFALSAIGLRYVAEANRRLKDIAQNNNVKTELATVMQSALRERAVSLYTLPILADPFEREAEMLRFSAEGARYIRAREQFEGMPLNSEEEAILARIREMTNAAQPEVRAVAEMSAFAGNDAEIIEQIRQRALPRQRTIAEQVGHLLQLQRKLTAHAVRDAEQSYMQMRNLMAGLGSLALALGVAIAVFVSRRATLQARQLANQALRDPLTGLANRSLLHDRIQHEIALAGRAQGSFGVALLDLDHFKEVNDTLGHEVGDELLREVGRRLQEAVRAEDTVARLGGDEYVVVLHDLDRHDVPAVARKLLAALGRPFKWQGQSIDVAASVGVSLYPSQCGDAGALLRCADIAMYTAKRAGSGYALYAPEQERLNCSDLSLKSDLRQAIEQGQLILHYQPQIDLHSQRVVGLEALVRWHHPQRGLLLPDTFIPLAEEAGLIGPLTQWVLHTALADLKALHRQGYVLNMAVNLSARNLNDHTLPASIQSALRDSGIAARQLTLEITESVVMAHPCDGQRVLDELDRLGVTLAVDDFGTGYSSLAYLKRLPVDELKIDKSFVMDMNANENDLVIVRSTIDLAHNLGLRVTAEGVEDARTWEQLHQFGCDASQGFFMGRPMPMDGLVAWLGASPRSMAASQPRQASA